MRGSVAEGIWEKRASRAGCVRMAAIGVLDRCWRASKRAITPASELSRGDKGLDCRRATAVAVSSDWRPELVDGGILAVSLRLDSTLPPNLFYVYSYLSDLVAAPVTGAAVFRRA